MTVSETAKDIDVGIYANEENDTIFWSRNEEIEDD